MSGRPRDPALDASISEAARRLIRSIGYKGFSIEALARAARVPKTTIYARWPSRVAVLDALLAEVVAVSELPGSRTSLVEMVADDLAIAASPEGRAIAQLVLEERDAGSEQPGQVRERLERRRAQYRTMLDDLHLRSGTVDVALDLLLGAIWGTAVVPPTSSLDPTVLVNRVLGTVEANG